MRYDYFMRVCNNRHQKGIDQHTTDAMSPFSPLPPVCKMPKASVLRVLFLLPCDEKPARRDGMSESSSKAARERVPSNAQVP